MMHIIATCSQVAICLAVAHCFVRGLWLNLVDLRTWSSRRISIGSDDPEF